MPRDSGDTAKVLILIGIVFQLLGILLIVGLAALIPFLGALVLALAIIPIIFLVLVYVFSYAPTARGEYGKARTPTLIFGILSLITFSLIPAILYIIAYVKLRDADSEPKYAPSPSASTWGNPYFAPTPAGTVARPPATGAALPSGSKLCASCGQPAAPDARFCRSCGAPFPPG